MPCFMDGGVKVLSFRGIPVRLHWTFFLILPYVAYSMSRRFEALANDASTHDYALLLSPMVWGVLLAILLFGSVLLHELGHVFVAMNQGSRVKGVTLMMLGGVSHIEEVSQVPRAEAKMAIVGPLVSIAIAVVAYAGHLLLGALPDAQFGLYYLAQINLGIALFNMLPAFPLDGGRVLRSMLEPKHGKVAATNVAATVGKVLAVMMGLFGILTANFLMVLIAVFVWAGGAAEARAAVHRERLAGVRVADMTNSHVPVVYAAETLARATDVMLKARTSVVMVRGSEGEIGFVTAEQIASVANRHRGAATVDVVASMNVPAVEASDPLVATVDAMDRKQLRHVPVLRGDNVVGVLSRDAIQRYLQLEGVLRPSLVDGDRRSLA
jgi:Zn-dependent protease/predicted transcriptional regulator